jgi:hypothetical protein
MKRNREGPLLALKFTPVFTSVAVAILLLVTSWDLTKSGVLDKVMEYIQALGK